METKRNKLERVNIKNIVFTQEPIKDNDHQLFEKLKLSIIKRGQIKSVLLCELENGMYECLEGSKIIKAMNELGIEEVEGYNLGVMSNDEKVLIRLENFRDYYLVNYVQVGKMIKEVSSKTKMSEICNTIPFDLRQAQHLVSMCEFDWQSFSDSKQIEGQVNLFDIIEKEQEKEIDVQKIYDKWEHPNKTQPVSNAILNKKQIAKKQEVKIGLSVEERIKIMGQSLQETFETNTETINVIEKAPEVVKLFEEAEVTQKNIYIIKLFYVYLDEELKFKIINEEDFLIRQEQTGLQYLYKDTFSNCRAFIYETEKQNERTEN